MVVVAEEAAKIEEEFFAGHEEDAAPEAKILTTTGPQTISSEVG